MIRKTVLLLTLLILPSHIYPMCTLRTAMRAILCETSHHVPMNSTKTITLKPADPKKKKLWATGQTGCTTGALYARSSDNKQYALLSHYNTDKAAEHIDAFLDAIHALNTESNNACFESVTLFVSPPSSLRFILPTMPTMNYTTEEHATTEEMYRETAQLFAKITVKLLRTKKLNIIIQPYEENIHTTILGDHPLPTGVELTLSDIGQSCCSIATASRYHQLNAETGKGQCQLMDH